jgi:hypothetical protein
MHLNASATRASRRWTTDEDTRLKKAVFVQTQDDKKRNWDAIAALVPGRTVSQCCSRWYHALDARIVRTTARKGKWTPDEDDKLRDAVQMHNGKNWFAITALVAGRTKTQCSSRWYDVLDPRIIRTTTRTGKWNPDEDDKLKDAVKMHNGENWFAITALVPGRTRKQCRDRWWDVSDARIVRTTTRTGKWTPDEDDKLKDAVKFHNGENWFAIARLVLGRTRKQCRNRWKNYLDSSRNTVKG